jgi:DNA-binding transcriptional ArsR family regulator
MYEVLRRKDREEVRQYRKILAEANKRLFLDSVKEIEEMEISEYAEEVENE